MERARIARTIQSLPRRHKILLDLYYIEELSLEEVAICMDTTPATVFKLYLEALQKIAK